MQKEVRQEAGPREGKQKVKLPDNSKNWDFRDFYMNLGKN